MKTRRTLWILGSLAFLALAPGCAEVASNRITIQAEQTDASPEILNSGLNSVCEIVGGKALYEGDIMVAKVILRSHVDQSQGFESRWLWWDADDFPIEIGGGGETWQPLHVNALDEKQVVGRATRPKAVKTRFELRYAR